MLTAFVSIFVTLPILSGGSLYADSIPQRIVDATISVACAQLLHGSSDAGLNEYLTTNDIQNFEEQLSLVGWKESVPFAIQFLKNRNYSNYRIRALEFRKLLWIVAKINSRGRGVKWKFRIFFGNDKSISYMGQGGYVVVFDPYGRIFRGLVEPELYERWIPTWRTDYSRLKEVP